MPTALEKPPEADENIIFSSTNAIEALSATQTTGRREAWCVGARTAARAEKDGYHVAGMAATAEELEDLIISANPGTPLVHVAGRHRRGDLAGTLTRAGIKTRTLLAYDQISQPLSDEARDLVGAPGDVLAPVFSPRTAQILELEAEKRLARIHAIFISEAASGWPSHTGELRRVAPTPDAVGLIATMGSLFDADRSA